MSIGIVAPHWDRVWHLAERAHPQVSLVHVGDPTGCVRSHLPGKLRKWPHDLAPSFIGAPSLFGQQDVRKGKEWILSLKNLGELLVGQYRPRPRAAWHVLKVHLGH
jgi:hypothetical protein